MKYSARSPTPCSWRLETTRFYGANGNLRAGSHVSITMQSGISECFLFFCCLFYR